MSHQEALSHLRAGRPQVAADLLKSQLTTQQADARGWFLLGVCHHALHELQAAAGAFARSLALDPSDAQTHLAYVSVLRLASDAQGALAASRDALRRLPNDARILYASALCLEDLGQLEEALALYDTSLDLAPTMDDALHNRGLLLARLGRFEDAEANQRRYATAHPDAARARAGLADALLALGRFEETLSVLDDLRRMTPQDVAVDIRRGVALASLHRFAEASQTFAAARTRDPQAVQQYIQRVAAGSDPELMLSPENIFICRSWTAFERCDWTAWEDVVTVMRRAATDPDILIEAAVPFMGRLLPLSGVERHAVVCKVSSRIDARHPPLPALHLANRPRIRIGVLSPDFRDHLNAYLLLPLFEMFDRSRFEFYAYSLMPGDGSAIRDRIRASASEFRDLQDLSDVSAAHAIRRDDIDILVDVAGLTTDSRYAIVAQRPARLQVNYLGFSCSLASPRVDYAVVDRIAGSDDAEWTESRAFLPDTHFLYDFRTTVPRPSLTRRDYGLPENAFIYCAFHRADKISPDAFALWMRILSSAPHAVLWFRGLSATAAGNLRSQAARLGLDPARLAFAPFEPSQDPRYLARHALGDLMLDALHHNAMTSACDALGMGLPLLTLRGSAMASRTGESLVRAAGLPELVADNHDDYVNIAVRLAREPAALRELKERLRANRRTAPLFDTAGRVRALEAAFQEMYDRMMHGEPPASFDV